MKKILYLIFLPLLLLSKIQLPAQTYINKIVLDAGHGGKDPGAVGKNNYEKDLALKIVLKTGAYIQKYLPEVEIVYTRQTDEFVELHERANIANKAKADLFISVHLNSSVSKEPYGSSTYVMGVSRSQDNLEVAKQENQAIQYEHNYAIYYPGFDPEKPETEILLTLKQNAYLEQSLNFALKIQQQFRLKGGRKDLGAKQAGFIVLWNTTMPSVLIETGFISNIIEERFLASAQGQDIIASAIFRAFRQYKAEKEKKSYGLVDINEDIVEKNSLQENTSKEKNQTDRKKNQIEKKEKNIVFKVQISASPTKISLNSPLFKGLKNIEENFIDKMYKYTIGNTSTFTEIQSISTEVRKKIPDAFIIAMKNGIKIPVNQARKELGM